MLPTNILPSPDNLIASAAVRNVQSQVSESRVVKCIYDIQYSNTEDKKYFLSRTVRTILIPNYSCKVYFLLKFVFSPSNVKTLTIAVVVTVTRLQIDKVKIIL